MISQEEKESEIERYFVGGLITAGIEKGRFIALSGGDLVDVAQYVATEGKLPFRGPPSFISGKYGSDYAKQWYEAEAFLRKCKLNLKEEDESYKNYEQSNSNPHEVKIKVYEEKKQLVTLEKLGFEYSTNSGWAQLVTLEKLGLKSYGSMGWAKTLEKFTPVKED